EVLVDDVAGDDGAAELERRHDRRPRAAERVDDQALAGAQQPVEELRGELLRVGTMPALPGLDVRSQDPRAAEHALQRLDVGGVAALARKASDPDQAVRERVADGRG